MEVAQDLKRCGYFLRHPIEMVTVDLPFYTTHTGEIPSDPPNRGSDVKLKEILSCL